jgi:hypothetical protein
MCGAVSQMPPAFELTRGYRPSMGIAGILIGIVIGLVLLFSVARVLFGAGCAVLLAGVVGYCFGGPAGAGVGLIVGLLLAPVTWLLFAPADD